MSKEPSAFQVKWEELVAKYYEKGFDSLDTREQNFWLLNGFRGSVMSGGLSSFLDEIDLEELRRTKALLLELRQDDLLSMLNEVQQIMFPEGIPEDLNERYDATNTLTQEQIDAGESNAWEYDVAPINQRFYSRSDEIWDFAEACFYEWFPEERCDSQE